MNKLVIGIDIGGTNLKAGLLTEGGTLIEERLVELEDKHKTEEGMVEACRKASKKLMNLSGFGVESVAGVGLGVAGVIDSGVITESPNFPAWKNFALGARLSEQLGIPVALENDVNAVARGEQWCGAVKSEKNFLCMAIGTGFGGAICLDGNIWRGVDGMAGEVGHINIYPDGPPCNCGSRGCLETYASSVALIRRVKEDDYRPVLDAVERDSAIPHKLAMLAQEGDATAKGYWDEMGRAIGLVLGGLLNTLNLKLVLMGGGLSKSFGLFYPAMEAEMQKRAFPAIWKGVEFRVSRLWEQAGIYGAAANLLIEWKREQKNL